MTIQYIKSQKLSILKTISAKSSTETVAKWYPVKTSRCQNVPQSKRPIVKTSPVKMSCFWSKTSPLVKTSPSQNVPVLVLMD